MSLEPSEQLQNHRITEVEAEGASGGHLVQPLNVCYWNVSSHIVGNTFCGLFVFFFSPLPRTPSILSVSVWVASGLCNMVNLGSTVVNGRYLISCVVHRMKSLLWFYTLLITFFAVISIYKFISNQLSALSLRSFLAHFSCTSSFYRSSVFSRPPLFGHRIPNVLAGFFYP